MTLRTRLTLAVAAIVALAVVGGAYAAQYSAREALRNETDKFLRERAAGFVSHPPPPTNSGTSLTTGPRTDQNLAPDNDEGRGRYYDYDAIQQVVQVDGAVAQLISTQPKLPVDGTDAHIAASGSGTRYRDVTVKGASYRMITKGLGRGNGAVQIARRVSETDDVLDVLRNRLVLIALSGVAFAALVAWLVVRRATKPIERLTDTAEHIAATQDLATSIPMTGNDEVGRLATSFNTMLGALDTSREQQRRLVVDASHELRTPLTAVRTNIEFLRHATTLDPDERAQLIEETRLELDELNNLVSEMVELATDVRSEEPIDRVDLAEIATDVAARFRRRTGREIDVAVLGATAIDGRRWMLDRALSNLVDNALKFSGPGTVVEIAVDGASITVADRGRGVAPEDRDRVFDRFYRATSARTLPGSGLGLSIVSQIAELHGGQVLLEAREGGGTIARLDLAGARGEA